MPITNSTQHSSMYGWNGSSWERVEVNSGNQLEVEVKNTTPIAVSGSFAADISGQYVNVANNTDPATGSKQDAQTSLLSSIDGSIVACNTGAVVVSSSALPSGAATSSLQTSGNASLSSMDGKITACDTGNVSGSVVVSNNTTPATSTLQTTGNASLSSMDGKITACDTGAVVVSSSALPSGAATATLQTSGNASLTALEGSLYAEGDAFGVSDVGVLVMGRNGTNAAKPIHITNNGDVEVEIADFVKGQAVAALSFPVVLASDSIVQTAAADVNNKGSYGNVANNVTINAGAQSGAADIADMNSVSILYQDTATSSFDGVDVLVSGDSTNYDIVIQLYPQLNLAGTLRYAYFQGSFGGLTDLKIQNNSSTDNYTNVRCSVYGSPN